MVAFSSGTSKYAAAERIVKPRQSMWHCVTVNDATHWNLLNTLNSSICSLTWDIEIMYSIVCRLYHERFNVELLYHCTIMYRARWFSPCRFFAEFIGDANRFCTNRYVRRTMHPPAIQWFWGTTTAACRKRSWAALVAAWKIVWWKHPDQQKLPNPNPDILTYHVLPWFSWLSLELDWLQIENFPKTMPEKLCKLEPQGKKSHGFVERKQRSHFSSIKSTWEN